MTGLARLLVLPPHVRGLIPLVISVASILAALGLSAIAIAATGENPGVAYRGMYDAAFGSEFELTVTLNKMVPRLLPALGIAFALRGGLWNIGAEGQIYIGAIAASLVALYGPSVPPVFALTLALMAGFGAAAMWGAIPGVLRAFRGINEVITSLMLVYIAINFNNYLVEGPLQPEGATFAQSGLFPGDYRLPVIWEGTVLHAGIVLGLVCAALIWIIIWRTTVGFELRTLGSNPQAARYAGMPVRRVIVMAMAVSGGLAGLAGASEVLGSRGRLAEGLSSGFGFEAIAVALLGANHPLLILPAAFLFGALDAGAAGLRTSVQIPAAIIPMTEGLAVLFVLIGIAIYRKALERGQAQAAAAAQLAEQAGVSAVGQPVRTPREGT